jgi:hypothetical protein
MFTPGYKKYTTKEPKEVYGYNTNELVRESEPGNIFLYYFFVAGVLAIIIMTNYNDSKDHRGCV